MTALSDMNKLMVMFTGLDIEQSVNLLLEVKDWSEEELNNALVDCTVEDTGRRIIFIAELASRAVG